jgi:hypothetical protein
MPTLELRPRACTGVVSFRDHFAGSSSSIIWIFARTALAVGVGVADGADAATRGERGATAVRGVMRGAAGAADAGDRTTLVCTLESPLAGGVNGAASSGCSRAGSAR